MSEPGKPEDSRSPSKRAKWTLLLIGLVACLGYLAMELYVLSGEFGFPLDDSWIHLQFARNLVTGEGLSYNPGQLVTGSTAPLWTALLSLLFWLPGDTFIWVKVVGMVLFLLGGFVTTQLARELGVSSGLSAVAGSLTLATSWLAWSALSGLEIPLFVVLSVAGITLHIRERTDPDRSPISLAVLGVSILVRPEAILLVGLALIDRLAVFRRDADGNLSWMRPPTSGFVVGLLCVAAIVIPVAMFNFWVAGSVLPTTFGAKTSGVERWLPEFRYLYTTLGILLRPQPMMTLFCGAGILVLVEKFGGRRDRGLLPAMWLLGLPLAYSTLDPPTEFVLVGNFGRYFFPLFPLLIAIGALGLERAVESLGKHLRFGKLFIPLRPVLFVLVFIPTVNNLVLGAGRYGQNLLNVRDSDVAAAEWLEPRLDPEAVLGVVDIGALKYMLPNRVVDLAGIASPEVRDLGFEVFLEQHQPDYLVLFPDRFQQLVGDGSKFRLIHSFPIPNNITMGGNLIGIFETPWNRYPLVQPGSGS